MTSFQTNLILIPQSHAFQYQGHIITYPLVTIPHQSREVILVQLNCMKEINNKALSNFSQVVKVLILVVSLFTLAWLPLQVLKCYDYCSQKLGCLIKPQKIRSCKTVQLYGTKVVITHGCLSFQGYYVAQEIFPNINQ